MTNFSILSARIWWILQIMVVLDHMKTSSFIFGKHDDAKWVKFDEWKSQEHIKVKKFEKVKFSLPVGEIRSSRTLQFSPTVSPQLRFYLVSSTQKLSYFLPHDFANFWSEVRYRYSEKTDEALFSKKIFLNDPGKKNCIFRWFLDHFSKTTVTILLKSF